MKVMKKIGTILFLCSIVISIFVLGSCTNAEVTPTKAFQAPVQTAITPLLDTKVQLCPESGIKVSVGSPVSLSTERFIKSYKSLTYACQLVVAGTFLYVPLSEVDTLTNDKEITLAFTDRTCVQVKEKARWVTANWYSFIANCSE
jgi:hypothetical protein